MRFSFLAVLLLISFSAGCTLPANRTPLPVQQEHQQVRETLDALVESYLNKNIFRFSELISDRYSGDRSNLELRVQRDFSAFFDVSIHYTLNNITSDGQGRVAVAVNFNRTHTDIATGWRVNQRGNANLIFIKEGSGYRLITQHQPLFGLTR